uniref:CD300 molecule like family member g n=1 Tax=Pipistrellus kuhlii TaxID=59472 RepID=A0A7J7U7B9_PIPKU|nr:CD300 molecule like family member g [Pipistrellus kuhlii]
MRPLVLLWGCLLLPGHEALTGPKKVRGFEGGTVSLQCSYSEKLRGNKKYWCKKAGVVLSRCSGIVYAREDGQERTEGRVSIQDHPQRLTLNVTLRELTLEDSGEYWCGITILGIDEVLLVSLLVLPGPCCSPAPTPSLQPLATSLQPKARAWHTQPPALTSSPGARPAATTQWTTEAEAEASPLAGTPPSEPAGAPLYTGPSPYAGTPPSEEHPPHRATSPHAGTTQPPTYPDAPSARDTTPSEPYSKAHILGPVLVLLILLLVTGLAVVGRCSFSSLPGKLDTETEKNDKVHLSHVTPEEEEASSQDPAGDANPGPPFHVSEEELRSSVFIPV